MRRPTLGGSVVDLKTEALVKQKGMARFWQSVSQPKNTGTFKHRVLFGTPTLGMVRIEWHNAMQGLVVPTNWSNSAQSPINFQTHDAQNLIADHALKNGFEWILFIEDDTVPPPDLLIKLAPYLEKKKIPVVSGLYYLKGGREEPLMFRGRGVGAYKRWKAGDKVWVDGVPTGCLLIHCSLIFAYAKEADDYTVQANGMKLPLKKIFDAPRKVFSDSGLRSYQKLLGTSDLWFCDEVIRRGLLKKAGWKDIAAKKYPFLVDTSIRCGHIDRDSGTIW